MRLKATAILLVRVTTIVEAESEDEAREILSQKSASDFLRDENTQAYVAAINLKDLDWKALDKTPIAVPQDDLREEEDLHYYCLACHEPANLPNSNKYLCPKHYKEALPWFTGFQGVGCHINEYADVLEWLKYTLQSPPK